MLSISVMLWMKVKQKGQINCRPFYSPLTDAGTFSRKFTKFPLTILKTVLILGCMCVILNRSTCHAWHISTRMEMEGYVKKKNGSKVQVLDFQQRHT